MDNFELIDDYLTNRLQEADRKAFEQQLEGDPSLREEVAFQRQVVEGVQRARMTELKSMLNNVPVGGSYWGGGKIAVTAISAGILITAAYLYMNDESKIVPTTQEEQLSQKSPSQASDVPAINPSSEIKESDSTHVPEAAENKSVVSKEKKVSPVRKPDIQVVDPSAEFSEPEQITPSSTPGRTEITVSKMEVITGLSDKKHNFHYQFVQGKLMLYGPFDKSLYEILEIHGEGHAVFLFYKENYYLLDQGQANITLLQPIRDAELLKKLKEYRAQ